MVNCDVCGGPIRRSNRYGVCNVNRDCHLEYMKRWQDAHPTQRADNNKKQPELRHLKRALYQASNRAIKRGMPFTLTLDNIPPVPDKCPILGVPFIYPAGDGRSGLAPSLDRIDNTRGYTPDNVHWISDRANRIKNDATVTELRMVADYFQKLQNVA